MRKLSESTWNDIRKQSAGKQERLEDNIDFMDGWEFYRYLKDHYKLTTNDDISYNHSAKLLNVCVFENQPFVKKYFQYYINSQIYTDFPEEDAVPSDNCYILKAIKKQFDTIYKFGYNIIEPKDPSKKVTNSFFLELLDFTLDTITGPTRITKI